MAVGVIDDLPILFDRLVRVEHELLLLASAWFIITAIDELVIDLVWAWLHMTGRAGTARLPAGYEQRPLTGRAAVIVAAWHEADVIGAMIAHTLRAWPQRELTLFVGCYCNDPDTLGAWPVPATIRVCAS
jgi:adsorption protein B